MKSRASIANHPLHPAMVALPIGAFFLAMIADIGWLNDPRPFWAEMAYYAIGIGVVDRADRRGAGLHRLPRPADRIQGALDRDRAHGRQRRGGDPLRGQLLPPLQRRRSRRLRPQHRGPGRAASSPSPPCSAAAGWAAKWSSSCVPAWSSPATSSPHPLLSRLRDGKAPRKAIGAEDARAPSREPGLLLIGRYGCSSPSRSRSRQD